MSGDHECQVLSLSLRPVVSFPLLDFHHSETRLNNSDLRSLPSVLELTNMSPTGNQQSISSENGAVWSVTARQISYERHTESIRTELINLEQTKLFQQARPSAPYRF